MYIITAAATGYHAVEYDHFAFVGTAAVTSVAGAVSIATYDTRSFDGPLNYKHVEVLAYVNAVTVFVCLGLEIWRRLNLNRKSDTPAPTVVVPGTEPRTTAVRISLSSRYARPPINAPRI